MYVYLNVIGTGDIEATIIRIQTVPGYCLDSSESSRAKFTLISSILGNGLAWFFFIPNDSLEYAD